MRFYRAFFSGVLLASALQGEGVFHINGSYDLNSNGSPEVLILNSQGVTVMLVEVVSLTQTDTLWTHTFEKEITISDAEILDINNDGLRDLIMTPGYIMPFENEPWLYVFPGNDLGFSKTPIVYDNSPFDWTVVCPTNLTIVSGESQTLGVCFGSPVRQAIIFDIALLGETITIANLQILSSPIFNNGYGLLQIGSLSNGGKDLVSVLSAEQNELKIAVYDIYQNFKQIYSNTIKIKDKGPLLGLGFESYKFKETEKEGILLPFSSENVHLLHFENDSIRLSKTSLSNTKAFPANNNFSLYQLLKNREGINILDTKQVQNNFVSIDNTQKNLLPPKFSEGRKKFILKELPKEAIQKNKNQIKENKAGATPRSKADYDILSPTLGDFLNLNNVKKDSDAAPKKKDKITVPGVNSDMKSVYWADEAGFLQMDLGEFVPEKTDTVQLKDPIPTLDFEITNFTSEAKNVLNTKNESSDTIIFNPEIDKIDLYYVLAMTSASDTKDRYVFDGEAPFGVAVNQVPLTGKATHFQHGISANLSSLKIGETFDFAYSLREKKAELDSITTLKMIHDMQTDVVLMSISPSEDSVSQSYHPESFDPKLYEFPNYFFDGFPNSLDMDFTDKLIRFSFNGIEDSVYQGLYLSSTTPSTPPQSLAVFVDEGVLQAIRGEIVVRPNGSKKVTTEFDLVGSVKPSVMFSKLIQEKFSEDLKEKLLQGASLEEPLFGPRGKLPKIIQEPRLPDVEPSQPEQEIPVELNRNNVLESNVKSDSELMNSNLGEKENKILIPETQKDGLIPSVLENNVQQKESEVVNDSLNLEKVKLEKQRNKFPSKQNNNGQESDR
tara:strand:+ start:94 stop:2604 length:2511 start_codon:yes stop_codon:yes gene_type:complete